MAFTYKEIKRAIRWKQKDNNEVSVSDYEIREAVNETIRYISNASALSNADFNEKQIWYKELEGDNFKFIGVPLPDDFNSLVAIKGRFDNDELFTPCESINTPQHSEYKIVGNRIYCGCAHFCLLYKATIPEVQDEDDEIELPYIFKDHFVQIAIMILNQEVGDVMRDAVEIAVQELLPRRRYRNAKIKMPFRIGW